MRYPKRLALFWLGGDQAGAGGRAKCSVVGETPSPFVSRHFLLILMDRIDSLAV